MFRAKFWFTSCAPATLLLVFAPAGQQETAAQTLCTDYISGGPGNPATDCKHTVSHETTRVVLRLLHRVRQLSKGATGRWSKTARITETASPVVASIKPTCGAQASTYSARETSSDGLPVTLTANL